MPSARIRVLLSRALDIVLARRRDARLSAEIGAHLDELTEEFVGRGLSPDEARLAAQRAFGGVDRIVQAHREQRGLPIADALVQDVRLAVRLILRERWFTAAVVIALALGIGSATAVFMIVNGMNLSALPVEEPDRILFVQTQDTQGGRPGGASFADFADWQAATQSFSGLAAFSGANVNVGGDNRPADRLGGTFISHNGFAVLRVRPLLGRDFAADDDRVGGTPVALLAYGVWRDRYGLDPTVVGRTLRVNGTPTVVIGVMPDGFRFPVQTDIWQPLAFTPGLARDRRDARTLAVFGRLADGATLETARVELTSIAAALSMQHSPTNSRTGAWALPFTERYAGRVTDPPPLLMMSGVALVMLIACANAASLLLARSAQRTREIAMRAAIGASRARILQQLLVESVLLAVVAAGLGLLLSFAGVRLFTTETADANLPYWIEFGLDARVFAFLACVCLGTGLAFGMAPAWHLARINPNEVIKEGGRGLTVGVGRRRSMSALLAAELALTLTLLVGAGLLLRSGAALYDADLVIDTPDLLTARLTPPPGRFDSPDEYRAFYARLQQRLDANPGIAASTIVSTLPFVAAPSRRLVLDTDSGQDDRPRLVPFVAASDRYFDTLRLAMISGRALTEEDARPGQTAAIVNERLAAQYFANADPIGRRIRLAEAAAGNHTSEPWLTIVGVAKAIRQNQNGEALPTVYVPLALQPPTSAALIVRGRAAGGELAAILRQELAEVDPDVALYTILPLERMSQLSRWIPRAMSTALSILGAIALVLATMGLYGVTAYGVAQRTAEVGVRTALGARRSQVLWLFVRGMLTPLSAGLALGIAGAVAIGQVVRGFLVQTSPFDALTLAVTAIGLIATALVACVLPARRAAKLDPVTALRRE